MNYPVYSCPDASYATTSDMQAHTSFFPLAPFAVGLGLGILPFAAAGLAYGGCRGPYCGGCSGPYCGGAYGPGPYGGGFYGPGPGWRGW